MPQCVPTANHQPLPMHLETAITEGAATLGLTLPTGAPAALAHYLTLLERWNRVYNLTAVRRVEDMVGRHILDSLAIAPWIHGTRILDVGSGAGLPGIPLAIALPHCQVCLLDSQRKRTRFLTHVANELIVKNHEVIVKNHDVIVKNIDVICARAEEYVPETRFDSIVSRAFGTVAQLIATTRHLCAPDGHLLAMKGTYPTEELAALPPDAAQTITVETLTVPGMAAQRHLVRIRAKTDNFR